MRARHFRRAPGFGRGSLLKACVLAVVCWAEASAQPVILSLLNNYSFTYPGLPNYAIAQGSLFDIFGAGLAARPTLLQLPPLSATLDDVTVNVTVADVTVHPTLYYLSPNQIAAVMPSDTPLGKGEITVTYNGATGAAFPITVVPSAFGILTLNNAGLGAAAAFDKNGALLTFANAASPGDEVMIWGTGIGPAPGGDADYQTPADLSGIPVDVKVGGVSATVNYRGRSIYPGVDQIRFVVPPDVQGCRVSVVVRTGDVVSNFATIPVASGGGGCSDMTSGITPQLSANTALKDVLQTGSVILGRNVALDSSGASNVSYTASASFQKFTPVQFQAAPAGSASVGSCNVYTALGSSMLIPPGFATTYLDAGSAVNVTGPAGAIPLRYHAGIYDSPASPVTIPDGGGTFALDNGPGGTAVGPFSVTVNMRSPLSWTNRGAIATVNRTQGVTVTWTGGDPDGYVQISGGSSLPTGARAFFGCAAPASAGAFTVPAEVLLSLPVASQGFLAVAGFSKPASFTATNLDAGFAAAYVSFVATVPYQ